MLAVARGIPPPAPSVTAGFAGGFDVVKTVTLFMTARFTCWGPLWAFGTAKRGREIEVWPRIGALVVTGPPKSGLGPAVNVGLGTVGILRGCFEVVAKSTGWLCSGIKFWGWGWVGLLRVDPVGGRGGGALMMRFLRVNSHSKDFFVNCYGFFGLLLAAEIASKM